MRSGRGPDGLRFLCCMRATSIRAVELQTDGEHTDSFYSAIELQMVTAESSVVTERLATCGSHTAPPA